MKPAVALLIPALLATACAGPHPAPPLDSALTPPVAWREASAIDAPAVPSDWWGGFGDPALTQVVAKALAQNDDIAIAAARVQEARGQFRLALAQRRPNVTADANGGRIRDVSAFGTPREQTVGQFEATASFDLDLFGRLAQASEAARAQLLSTAAARDNVRLAVAATAADGYIGLRALDARMAVLRDTLAARRTSLNLARRRSTTGYSPMLDLRQAEADYHATEQLIPATELAIRRQEDGLSLILGESPRDFKRGVDLAALAAPTAPAGLPSALLRRRPDIAQAEQALAASDRSLDSARAAFMPDFQLTATGGFVASTLLADPITIFTLGGGILAPIFSAGRLEAGQDIAAARRDQAAFAYRRTALAAFRDVDDALTATTRTAEQERDLIAQRDALAQALTLATNRYRSGYSPYLEQLDAQRSLLAAELALVQARSDRLTASVALFQALGGGWRREDLTLAVASGGR